jgi:hypothetical protein
VTSQQQEPAVSILPFVASRSDTIARNATAAVLPSSKRLANSTTPDWLSEDVLQETAALISRIWPHKPVSSWCNSNNTNNNNHNNHNFSSGLLLVKVPKSASSTAAGIVLRIQEHHDCRVEWKHRTAVNYADRNCSASFLVAPIRQPHSRALSNMSFHDISFHGKLRSTKPPSDKRKRKGLFNKAQFNFILGYTTTDKNYTSSTLTTNDVNYTQSVNAIATGIWRQQVAAVIQSYDFLMVVERLDESLVTFAMLTGLPMTDMVTMSSKMTGMWYYTGRHCMSLVSPVQSRGIQQFFQSPKWKIHHWADNLLHRAAAASLDQTVASLCADSVQQQVTGLRALRQTVEAACANETMYPCSATGTPQLCNGSASPWTSVPYARLVSEVRERASVLVTA